MFLPEQTEPDYAYLSAKKGIHNENELQFPYALKISFDLVARREFTNLNIMQFAGY